MIRVSLIVLALAACQAAQSAPTPTAQPAPVPRNFVCERVAIANPQAKCIAELSGVGDLSTHTARVDLGKDTLACAINAQQVGVVCGSLFVEVRPAPQPQQPQQPTPAPEKKK